MRDAVRVIAVLIYHLRRLLGAVDRSRTALLADPDHVVRCGWLVTRSDGKKFNVRKLQENQHILVRARFGLGLPKGRFPSDRSFVLLAGGHARLVDIIDSAGALSVGAEYLSGPATDQQTLRNGTVADEAGKLSLAVYSELGAQIRALTDVRFKLLTLVPTVSALALVAIVSPGGPLKDTGAEVRLGAALAGLVVTAMIRMYDVRNSELYDDLISRARSLENMLGVEYGAYMKRRRSVWPVEHDRALRWLYWAVLAAWLVAAVAVP